MTMTTALQLIASNVANIYHGDCSCSCSCSLPSDILIPQPSSGHAVRILLCIIEHLMMTLSLWASLKKKLKFICQSILQCYLRSLNSNRIPSGKKRSSTPLSTVIHYNKPSSVTIFAPIRQLLRLLWISSTRYLYQRELNLSATFLCWQAHNEVWHLPWFHFCFCSRLPPDNR